MSEVATKLRDAAAKLRATEMDEASRHHAADELDQVADKTEAAYTRLAEWLARAAFTCMAACPVLLVAGIWADWRMAATGGVALAAGLVLAGLSYWTREARDE